MSSDVIVTPDAAPPPAPRTGGLQPTLVVPTKRRRRSLNWVRLSAFFLFVLSPTLGMLIYALVTPSPLYSSEVAFAIRSRDGHSSVSGLGAFAGTLGIGLSGSNDIYALRSHLQSPGLFEKLDAETGFSRSAGQPERDWLVRLPPDASAEQRMRYYRSRVRVRLATLEQIVTVDVQGFSPEEARLLAKAIVAKSDAFINQLNDRAKEDFVVFAAGEVRKAEERVARTRIQITDWRNANLQLDPQKAIDSKVSIIASLEADLAKIRAEISQLENTTTDVTARVRQSRLREQALARQIAQERTSIAGSGSEMSKLLSQYERLLIERDLAEKSYATAIDSLKAAQQEAMQKQKYIVVTADPSTPQEPSFPHPIYHTALIFGAGLFAYLIFVFAVALTRDYREMS